MHSRAWLVLMMVALFVSTTAETCSKDENDGGVTDAGEDGGDGGDGGHTAPCPLLAGTYTVTGCPATSCTIDQEANDCFASVSCQTSIGALGSNTMIESDGSFMVTAGPGSCNLVGQDTGFFSGTCNDLLGLDSCSISGTKK